MAHWLRPMLAPQSIAIVGASERADSLAAITHQQLKSTGFSGEIYSVNPKYETLYDATCYAQLADLPVVPDLVVYAINGLVLEKSFDQALELGVGGIVMYAANHVEGETAPRLTERLKAKAEAAGIPVCGGNSMGFYNYDDQVFLSFDHPPVGRPAGHISLILHSGSGMTYLANNDTRFCFNYVIASAQETHASVGDYMDYLLEQPSTRVIAIFLETVRNPEVFVAALEKAAQLEIPVVITALGRTEKSASLAKSHSGAIVGDHEAFSALCQRHGAILCRDLDEMITTAMLFGAGFKVDGGALASLLDSGGMRELMLDLGEDHGVEFAQINEATTAILREHLEPHLEAVNPMDGMGDLGHDVEKTYLACGKALLDDPATGILSFEFEFRDGFSHYPVMFDVARELSTYNEKPVLLLNSSSYSSVSETATRLTGSGLPVINGIDVALRSIRNLIQYRPIVHESGSGRPLDQNRISHWQRQLKQVSQLDELDSLSLMSDFNLPVVANQIAENWQQVLAAGNALGYPLVMKTAVSGIAHKSDQGGVKLNLETEAQLKAAYQDLKQRLGSRVVLMPMVTRGVEVSLGMKNDPQYGPLVIVACGGILIELMAERAFRLAPVNIEQAEQMIDSLRLAKLLSGIRGQPAVDRNALVDLLVLFSELVFHFRHDMAEIDLNPVIVSTEGCTIVDALIVSKT
ncbi:MAG: acetate--CoA ligase family protein [Pseudomonadota bacterium]